MSDRQLQVAIITGGTILAFLLALLIVAVAYAWLGTPPSEPKDTSPMSTTVTTQSELDAAIKAGANDIVINSPAGVWLELRSPATSRVVAWGSSRVVAWGSSRVEARGSSRVEAWESSRVVARGSSRVEARGSSRVEAWESSRVVAWESSSVEAWESSRVEAWESSSVVAWESSRVVAWGSSRVEAWESSRVVAWESSRVVAWESSRVEARGSSRVEARGSSSVEARESSRVEASRFVAVHLFSKKVTLAGEGHIIDVTDLDLHKAEDWLAWNGVKVIQGKALLFKAVDDDLMAGLRHKPTVYPVGKKVEATDWRATDACGYGLHFASSPAEAKRNFQGGNGGPRYLAVGVPVKDLVALGDKCKAPTCKVLYEVDIHGDKIEQPATVKA